MSSLVDAAYRNAWKKLQRRVETKTSWGRNELRALMAETFGDSFDEIGEERDGAKG